MPATARSHLETEILPFWLDHGVDSDRGGVFTCFDNRGRALQSTDKYTWSQGRAVWMFARAARLAERGLLDVDADRLADIARHTASFLIENAVRADGTCHFVLSADGTPAAGPAGETHSVYADCFVVMGLAELARLTGSADLLDQVAPVLARATADIEAGTADTPPYAVPAGFRAYGPAMILLNTRLEHSRALAGLRGLTPAETIALTAARDAVWRHRRPDGTFQEMIPDEDDDDSLVARHRVPGHAIEGLWVLIEAGDVLTAQGDPAPGRPDPPTTADLLTSVDALCTSAWDESHGGLLRYVDAVGPVEPTGADAGTGYESLVRRTWSTKLWWVHTEAAYTTALAAQRWDDAAAAAWFDRIWTYTTTTFPGRDEGEEWIQIRDRAGRPLDEVVALPVKDPFHIARNLMQLVELDTHR